ncbi:MAG: hypothetical protein KBS59_00255 [Clostridiales bacterium]|nr:hypothetical protein [Clostridiales bacterium]
MSKLKVKFMRYKNVVLAEILEQSEDLLGKIHEIHDGDDDYLIKSLYLPQILKSKLFIRGSDKLYDHNVASYSYSDTGEAIKAIKNFTEIINEINSEEEKTLPGEDFEITIAG